MRKAMDRLSNRNMTTSQNGFETQFHVRLYKAFWGLIMCSNNPGLICLGTGGKWDFISLLASRKLFHGLYSPKWTPLSLKLLNLAEGEISLLGGWWELYHLIYIAIALGFGASITKAFRHCQKYCSCLFWQEQEFWLFATYVHTYVRD